MENLNDDAITHICEQLDTKGLETFMKTSKRIFEVCKFEWNRRHLTEHSKNHRFLTEEQRRILKECMKKFSQGKLELLIDIHYRILEEQSSKVEHQYFKSSEILSLTNKLVPDLNLDTDNIENLYGENSIQAGEDWDYISYSELMNKLNYSYFSDFIDKIHSDKSLLEIHEFLRDHPETDFIGYGNYDCEFPV